MIIKLYTFIIFAACPDASLEMDTANVVCVCAVGYYQITEGTAEDTPVCTVCPSGSTTPTSNSQDINDCCKNARIITPIDWH